jgi:LPXTG-motif cell wall-anchored protein
VSGERSLFRAVRAAAASGVVACLGVLTMPASPAHADPAPVSFFTDSATPAVANWDDANAVEVGVKFSSDVDGTVSALRLYKGDKNTGTHTGSIWSAEGVLLGTAIFTDESASGWQKVTFAEAVEITKDTTYVASYHTSVGFYSVTVDQFDEGLTSGPLHIPANGGAFKYGTDSAFPGQAAPHNYWVDIVFHKKKHPEPTPSGTEPAPSASPSESATPTATPTATATAPPGGGGGGGSLPITGANAPLVAGAGVLLAVIGGLLAWRHRRRTMRFVA